MPQLPTLTVTKDQADRMLSAFGTVDDYKNWLANQIIEFVKQKEWQDKFAQVRAEQEVVEQTIKDDLMPAELVPVVPVDPVVIDPTNIV